jgi:two-component system, NarL family, sensor kinase
LAFSQFSELKVVWLLCRPTPDGLSNDLEISIFRVVQESLTNIYRHPGSATAAVSIEYDAEMLRLSVEDSGRGMTLAKQSSTSISQPGVGVRCMGERIRQLGGTFQIESNGSGPRIIACFPMADQAATEK